MNDRRARGVAQLALVPLAVAVLAYVLPGWSPSLGVMRPPFLWELPYLFTFAAIPSAISVLFLATAIVGRRRGEPPPGLTRATALLCTLTVPFVIAIVVDEDTGRIQPVTIAVTVMAALLCVSSAFERGWRRWIRALAAYSLMMLPAAPFLLVSELGSSGWLFGGAILILVPLSAWGVWPGR